MNSSARLNWVGEVASVISHYMARMREAGYAENYRKNTLKKSLRIYDKMVEDDMEGKRPKGWNVVERKKEKIREKHNWSNRGGHIAPIFVPPTSNGKLARELRYIAESEAGVLFKVVETGGRAGLSM